MCMYFSIPEVGSNSRVVSITHSKPFRTLLQEQTGPYSNPPYAGQMAGKQENPGFKHVKNLNRCQG